MEYLTLSEQSILPYVAELELDLASHSATRSSSAYDVSGNGSSDTPTKEIHYYSERIVNETPTETETIMQIDSPWATMSYQDNLAMIAPAIIAGVFIGITISMVAEIISALAKKAKGD